MADGDPPARKALLQALVQEIRVVSRAEIYPFFNLPVVRPPYGSVPPAGIEPAHAVWEVASGCANEPANPRFWSVQDSGAPVLAPVIAGTRCRTCVAIARLRLRS